MSDSVTVPADRLAALERVDEAARTWLRCWETAQETSKTLVAFESSKRLAEMLRATAPARV